MADGKDCVRVVHTGKACHRNKKTRKGGKIQIKRHCAMKKRTDSRREGGESKEKGKKGPQGRYLEGADHQMRQMTFACGESRKDTFDLKKRGGTERNDRGAKRRPLKGYRPFGPKELETVTLPHGKDGKKRKLVRRRSRSREGGGGRHDAGRIVTIRLVGETCNRTRGGGCPAQTG